MLAARRWVFLIAEAGFVGFYLWGLTGLPGFGNYPGPDLILAGPVQRFQSGVVNDYITWVVIGVTCLGAALALSIR